MTTADVLRTVSRALPDELRDRLKGVVRATPLRVVMSRDLEYDVATSRIMHEVIEPDSHCIDVGAHRGTFMSEITALAPEGHHLAFEPLPHLAEELRAAAATWPGFEIHECALADGPGEATFVHVVNRPAYSGLRERGYDHDDVIIETIAVRVERLDDLVDRSRPIRFIKIDVEGGELEVLRGAEGMLRRDRPYVIFEHGLGAADHYGTGPDEVYDLLTDCGLYVTTFDRWFAMGHLARLSRDEFIAEFETGSEYYFLAHPSVVPAAEATLIEGLVTVVVPTLNEEAAIDACLRSIRNQSYSELEILIVDGESGDRTREIVASHAADDQRIRLIANPDRVIPAALNRATWAASGEWLVRVDAHATIPRNYVERLVDHLVTGRWGGVGGRKDGTSTEPTGRAIAEALGSPFGVGNSVYHHGTTVQAVDHLAYGAYPLEVARSIGGWNERLVANEDYEFDHRVKEAGHELLFDPAISVRWVSQQRLRGLGRQYRRYGRAKAQVMQLSPESTKARHLMAPALVGWTAMATVVGFRRPRLGAAMMAPYAAGVATATALTSRSIPPSVAIRTAPAFVTMHFAWGVGWLERMILGRRPTGATARHRPMDVRQGPAVHG